MTIMDIARIVESNQGRMFLVGGAVRDEILGRASHDHDFVVVGLSQEQFFNLFPKARLTGKDFPVFRMIADGEEIEIALARKERKVAEGHNGFSMMADGSVAM